ncbi:5-deoxy-glucuronate isomerase [Alicyclobacillus dauci]|uniref:5-deoxy-glucuronate isomerase n=1 Tax=Alicyclobacillus dauci TaxID=1475485 RepID=A0ABY6Z598_9BACL|nr:5-deoxy-glucuronate isomerase [Alicyclobacillus dauci]WAH38044.1 5-deoxy-glucuronate isomerase [Alicyclobacillus dauci]
MMLVIRAQEQVGYREIVGEQNEGNLKLLRFGLLSLEPGKAYTHQSDDCETVLVLLQGGCTISVSGTSFEGLTRENVFKEKATAVYVPVGAEYTVVNTASGETEIAVCRTPATERFKPFVVKPEDVWSRPVGKDNFLREVHDIVVKNAEGRVGRIIVGETFNLPGNWSSYPPHKHDDYQSGIEACMEEVYHYRMAPEQGFGFQSIYTTDGSLDEVFRVKHKDSFMIPYGYHPVCAAAGYQLYYLWFMAGETDRTMIPNDDPAHSWVRQES